MTPARFAANERVDDTGRKNGEEEWRSHVPRSEACLLDAGHGISSRSRQLIVKTALYADSQIGVY